MKKLTFFLILIILLAGCKAKDEPKEPFVIDPLATVSIKPETGAWSKSPAMKVKSVQEHLSALDIVKKTHIMQFYNSKLMIELGYEPNTILERGFDALQRDTISEIPSLKMWATDIIKEDGELLTHFIEGNDVILIHFRERYNPQSIRDTIGYIPNSVIRSAETAIKTAYNNNDPDEVLRLFNDAFTFRPITGAEYKALKLQGNQ